MGSEVSQSKVAARATAFWQDAQPTLDVASISRTHALISRFLDMEYQRIPEKERIGKGAVFLCRPVAASLAAYASGQAPGKALQPTDIIAFVNAMYGIKDTGSRPFGKCMAIFFLAEFTKQSADLFMACEALIMTWASAPDWEVREMAIEPLIHAVQRYPHFILPRCQAWLRSPDENIRRFVAEGLRPRAGTRWLRDPSRNAIVLDILAALRHDPAEYVRKSVGNNLKDLSKYMPAVVLDLAARWVHEEGIEITPDLASRTRADLGQEAFALVWILKQGLRWLNERNPEYRDRIASILGQDYVSYFHEKQNRRARPTGKRPHGKV